MGRVQEVQVEQSTQRWFDGVLVGVMVAALKEGVPTTRLLIRKDEEREQVDLPVGDQVDLFGHGTLQVIAVNPAADPRQRAKVTLAFTPAEETSP